ncbi:hypothetical protein niasHS_001518 [Heterodera schachtii]|uniref:Uncharacterized protein n=1 Tax=Heterodera schachtii TaxID=97005 RepID=A0ABD2KDN7_HETSC
MAAKMMSYYNDSNSPFLITLLGRICLSLLLAKVCRSLYNILYPYVIAKPRDLHELAGGDANWAVVTGATDGIGKAYAAELALRGFNLVLISRSAHKLEAVATELKQYSATSGQRGEVQLRTVQFDFTNANPADYERHIFGAISDLNIGILVNNVGMGNPNDYPERFDEMSTKLLSDMTIVNTLPVTVLSSFVLRQMVKRRRGAVINISSASAYMKWYQYAVYSSTKSFIVHLSEILRKEFASDCPDIAIQTVCPMVVATKLTQRSSRDGISSLLAASPTEFARQAIQTVGLVPETSGCLSHQIQVELLFSLLLTFVPNSLFDFFVRLEAHLHKNVLNTASKQHD